MRQAHENLDPIVRANLEELGNLDILAAEEIVVELELVGLGTAPGVLILTATRVIFFRASPFGGRHRLVAVPLLEVTDVEASERRSPIRKRGVLAVHSTRAEEKLTFEYIRGGKRRADEIAQSILRQRRYLHERSGPAAR